MSKVYCIESGNHQELNDFKITGQTQKLGNLRCAVIKKEGDSNTYLKPWDQLSRSIYQRGENNPASKLKTDQVRQIIKDAYTKPYDSLKIVDMAKQYNVQPDTISDIINGKSWRHVTTGLIAQLKAGNKEVLNSVVSATNNMKRKTTKLNPSMAKFMVRDHFVNNVSVKNLSKKYLISESAARRVVTGKAWKATTVPAIKEFSVWKN